MFKVAIITPTTGLCRMSYAHSLVHLTMYFAQNAVFGENEPQTLLFGAMEGSGISANYASLVTQALKDKSITHFLCVEDDMGFASDCLHMLARRRLPIVGANYPTNRGKPMKWTAIGLDGSTHIPTLSSSTGIEEVSYVAQGLTLIERGVFEKIEKPWFLLGYNKEHDIYSTQDYYFCVRAKANGFKIFVDHDVSKKVWHVGALDYRWNEFEGECAEKEN